MSILDEIVAERVRQWRLGGHDHPLRAARQLAANASAYLPHVERKMLVEAAAWIVAEIERLDRQALSEKDPQP